MTKVVPAILVQTKEEYEEKINNKEVRQMTEMMQFDILDGSMYSADSWTDFETVAEIGNTPDLELHLMIEDPVKVVKSWIDHVDSVKRAIIHAEIQADLTESITAIKEMGIEVGLAINPETSIDDVKDHLSNIDVLLIMGVHPGMSGQKYIGDKINRKIYEAHKKFPNLLIAVDGGITLENTRSIVAAGASQLCVSSAIWGAEDKSEAIAILSTL